MPRVSQPFPNVRVQNGQHLTTTTVFLNDGRIKKKEAGEDEW